MTYKQIETSREIRLWIGQIVVPICGVAAAVIANPEARQFVIDKANKVRVTIKNKFKKD